jgi:hypothetical protein
MSPDLKLLHLKVDDKFRLKRLRITRKTSLHDMPQYKSGYIAYTVNMYKLTAYRLFYFENYCSLGRYGVKSEGCVQAF